MSNLSGIPAPTPVDASEIVNTRFAAMQLFVDGAYTDLEESINNLAEYDPGNTTLPPALAEIDLGRFSGNYPFPDVPSAPSLVAAFPSAPGRPNLDTLIPTASLPATPTDTIPLFTDSFQWVQNRYVRDGLLAYRLRLVDFINNGGTGIAAAIEQAIYDRDRTRQEFISETRYLEIQNHFESRGNTMPSGQHAAAVNGATKDAARMYEEISRSVMIKAAELEQENMRIAQDSLTKTDTILVSLHGAEEQRDLDGETARITSTVAVYEALIRGIIARFEVHKLTIDATVAYILANVEVLKATVDVYQADISAFSAKIAAEAARLTTTADIYKAAVAGFAATIDGLASLAGVDIAQYQVEADIAKSNSANEIKIIDLNLQSVAKRIDTRVEAMKSVAAVSAQIVASALNSVSTSASIGQNNSSSFSHAYDELKDVNTGIATSHNFSGTID